MPGGEVKMYCKLFSLVYFSTHFPHYKKGGEGERKKGGGAVTRAINVQRGSKSSDSVSLLVSQEDCKASCQKCFLKQH